MPIGALPQRASVGQAAREHRDRHLDETSRVDIAAQWQSCPSCRRDLAGRCPGERYFGKLNDEVPSSAEVSVWDPRGTRLCCWDVRINYSDKEKDWPGKYPLVIGAPFAESSLLPYVCQGILCEKTQNGSGK